MSSARQKRARAHHVLPQFYLRAWADDDDAVAMLRRDGKEVVTGTTALGVEKDFYTVTDPRTGERTSMIEEGVLRRWDGEGSSIHRRMLEGDFPLSDESRLRFALWLALQYVRGRQSRQTAQEARDLILKLLVTMGIGDHDLSQRAPAEQADLAPEVGLGIEVPDLRQLPEEAKAALRDTDAYEFEASREQLVQQMITAVPDVAEPLIMSDWWLMRFDAPVLFTSDEPISLYREPSSNNPFEGVGPQNASVIVCPLAPDRCMLMFRGRSNGDRVVDGPPDAARDFNEMLLHGPWRQLFRRPGGEPFPMPPPLPERFVEVV